MARYFFHLENGRRITDTIGSDHVTKLDARRGGLRFLCELLPVIEEELWSHGAARVVVTDADELILFTIDVAATAAPAAR